MRVVEPVAYEPTVHADLFQSVMAHLIAPPDNKVDGVRGSQFRGEPDRIDLVTFPEAFADVDALLKVLDVARKLDELGCVHVGLRPDSKSNHLFSCDQLVELVDRISRVSNSAAGDLVVFRTWLSEQNSACRFNVGCVFTVDAEGALRVCLHPKLVRSHFELSIISEHHMSEAELITVITLEPTNQQFLTINLQPIICSDALDIQTDKPGGGPLKRLNTSSGAFNPRPPDHVDVISVATCTPQSEGKQSDGSSYREWHSQFQKTFTDVAGGAEYLRHHNSIVVLSNYTRISEISGGGVSGVFLPVPPKSTFRPDLTVSCYGRPKAGSAANRWSAPADQALQSWNNRGFVVGLDPFAVPASASVMLFDFTVQRFLRETSLWDTPRPLSKCAVRVGSTQPNGALTFEIREYTDAE